MELAKGFWSIVSQLRGGFSRERTYIFFILILIAFCTRQDYLGGVSSFIRDVGISSGFYQRLLHFFHSSAVQLDTLTALWNKTVLSILSKFLFTINGKFVFVIDGIKIGKEGVRMPGVKCLYQDSQSNSKAEFIMGHSVQVISVLAGALGTFFAIPIIGRISEGTKLTNRDRRTLYDKAVEMMKTIMFEQYGFYLVADAYYPVRKMFDGIGNLGGYVISRAKTTVIGYEPPAEIKKPKRGRPRKYGKKVKLKDLFSNNELFSSFESNIYGEKGVTVQAMVKDLLIKGGRTLRFALYDHPTRGRLILVSTDLSLSAKEIYQAYGLRFKIEVAFKSLVHKIGAFGYRFWMKGMKKTKRGDGTKHLHRESQNYRESYLGKLLCYNCYIQIALIAQGIMQCLSILHHEQVWSNFGSWLRTVRSKVLPSEMVVGMALKNCLPVFLVASCIPFSIRKFLVQATLRVEEVPLKMTG